MLIRRALPQDTPVLHGLVQAGFETYRAFAPEGWEPPDRLTGEHLAQAVAELSDPDTLCLVAEDGGSAVATVRMVRPDRPSPDGALPERHLKHLFVAQSHWGSGLARELHARAVASIPAGATARLFTPALQARARRFYEREGWALHGDPYPEPAMGLDLVEYRRQGTSKRAD